MSAETKTRAKVSFTIMGETVQVPEGMTLLNALQVSGHDHLKGCGCRMGDCGECAVYYRKPGSAVTLRDFSCEMRVSEGLEVMDVPFKWSRAFKLAQNKG
ncbi:MAG TPA: 2Fe-2S iron-sulfur cluster-binding protein [Magnetospirillaceae bacterium]